MDDRLTVPERLSRWVEGHEATLFLGAFALVLCLTMVGK